MKPGGDHERPCLHRVPGLKLEAVGGTEYYRALPSARRDTARSVPADLDARVEDVEAAARELEGRGFALLHHARTEPWGQTVARLQTGDGANVGISYAPWML